ncbi:LysR family transcriptional regulator [Paenarthrobacter ureafaciens]|uniref:LysR family transcriptional regulator n=1 Tax=Paenarthrobacter ureafaciens TaxID=37931 RepID=UPI0019171263|nr:LysR family transcriptional regulator [Paenarthrobacter ureafaciens]QQQ64381.1 LysR family transcriptional regulator [Paenarthrobacter ureafaciens]
MNLKVPDLSDLHLLVTVAATGSIGQAASELRLAQPSASRRLASLERSLRVQLLHRGPRGTTLTPNGRVVVDWAATLLRATEQFTNSVVALGQERNALLNVAVSMTIAEYYAPNWLAKVRSTAPDMTVTLSMANSSEVMSMVESGRVDIGLVECPQIRPSLRSHVIGADELAIAVLPDHPWARSNRGVSIEELASAGLLVREQGSGTRETLDQALSASGFTVRASLELASNTALKSAALAGMGPVVLPAIALTRELENRSLVEVELEDLSLSRPLSLVWSNAAKFSSEGAVLLLNAARGDRQIRGRIPRLAKVAS